MVALARRGRAGLRGHGAKARIPGGYAGVPGFSLHEELAALVATGLTPYEAIRSATAEAARFAGGDPLADLETLRRPVAVLLRGEWLPRCGAANHSGSRPPAHAMNSQRPFSFTRMSVYRPDLVDRSLS